MDCYESDVALLKISEKLRNKRIKVKHDHQAFGKLLVHLPMYPNRFNLNKTTIGSRKFKREKLGGNHF